MEYMIGCNYWGSKYGTDMWKYWDEDSVRNDIETLSEYGVKYLRVFPNWRDFQPIHVQRGIRNMLREYCFKDDTPMDNELGISEESIDNFRTFAKIAEDNGIKLVVSIVTGWMSGRLYAPPAIEDLNHINDPRSLMWQMRLTKGLVNAFKDIENIVAWDIGNECNNMSQANTREEAYVWTATIRNAIMAEDNTRPVMSGMHMLKVGLRDQWLMFDQGEITDVLCPHPYPSPSVGGDIDPMNCLRTTMVPAAQVELYAGIGKKPAMIQESGTFNLIVGKEEVGEGFLRSVMASGWANGSLGYLWWCAHDQKNLTHAPYSWSMNENELGMLKEDLSPKRVAIAMKEISEAISSMPFDELPKATKDVCCIIPDCLDNYYYTANASYILAKQAGLNLEFVYYTQDIPEAKMYILPSLRGWSPIGRKTYLEVLEYVKKGAKLLITDATGFITEMDEIVGLESYGMIDDFAKREADFGEYKLPFSYDKKFMIKSVGAEVLCEDEDGTVIFSKNKFGNGEIYFLNFALETQSYAIPDGYNKHPFYMVYKTVGKNILDNKPIVGNNPQVDITIHPLNDTEAICVMVNYSPETQKTDYVLNGYQIKEVIYNDAETIGPNRFSVIKIVKK